MGKILLLKACASNKSRFPARPLTPSCSGRGWKMVLVDKDNWSEKKWQDYVQNDTVQTWSAWLHSAPYGYFELEQRGTERVEIDYFGILEQFPGRELGKRALSIVKGQGQQRITVNTCSLNHPAALSN